MKIRRKSSQIDTATFLLEAVQGAPKYPCAACVHGRYATGVADKAGLLAHRQPSYLPFQGREMPESPFSFAVKDAVVGKPDSNVFFSHFSLLKFMQPC